MCTVTYIPLPAQGYFLTSNRDERTSRPIATPPQIVNFDHYKLLYPKDPMGGGTWIASDNRGKTICLLNGAFFPHVPQYPYRQSRGQVVIDFFKFNNANDFVDVYDLNNIEPFTLIIIQNRELFEFRWDGSKRYFKDQNSKIPAIWSSVTLYSQEIIEKRIFWFKEWLGENPFPAQKDVLNFHIFGGEGNKKTDILMEREGNLRTVSITSVLNRENEKIMYYKDIQQQHEYTIRFEN